MIESFAFDMLIADVHMPRLDGLEMLARVRALPTRIPCILMSADWDISLKNSALRLEPELVVDKPFRIASIADTINKFLRLAAAEVY